MESAIQPNRQRSTASLNPEFRVLFEAAPHAYLVVFPDDPAFTIAAASDRYVTVCGVKREDLLGRGLFDVFPDNPDDVTANGSQNVRASFRRALATRTADQMPLQRYDVEVPGEGRYQERYWSAVNTPVLDAKGQVEYLLHSVEEVTEKVAADRKAHELARELETSSERFRQFAEASTFGLLVTDLEGNISYINAALLRLIGYRKEEITEGLVRWDQLTPPEFAAVDADAWRQVATTGTCAPYEKVYLTKDGRRLPILIAASLLGPVNGRTEVATFVLDLRERKQSERDAFLVRLSDATRPLLDACQITGFTARLLGEHLHVNCCFAHVEEDENTLSLTGGYSRDTGHIGGRPLPQELASEWLRVMRDGQPYVVVDCETDPRAVRVLDSYRSVGIRSIIWTPLLKGGRLAGAMAVHQTAPRAWRQDEVQLVQSVANRCWESIERARVGRELQESEQRLRLAQRAGGIGSFEWLMKEKKVIWTPEHEALYGLAEGDFEGKPEDWSKRVFPTDAERVFAGIRDCVARTAAEYLCEFRAVLPDGTLRWLRVKAQFFYDEMGEAERMVGISIDIDAQKRAEEHLHQQWHSFDTALSNTPDFTYTFDLDGRLTYANRALLSLWQTPLNEALGKNFFELDYPPDLAHRLHRQIQQVIATKQFVRDQTPYAGPTGETRGYEYILVPVLAANGEVEAVAGSTRDMTERNKAEEFIEEDRRRWRELLLRSPAGMAVLRGPEHRFEWVNAEYLRILGRPVEAIIGNTVAQALPEMEGQDYLGLLNAVFQTGEPFTAVESLVRLKEGDGVLKNLYIHFSYAATRDVAGAIDGIFAHIIDVTDMVLARKHVEESERQFRTLAETIPHLAWMADETGHISWYNQRWYDYTGTTFGEMEGWGWEKVHDEMVLPEVLKHWQHALSSGEPFEMVFPLKGANGVFRSFLTRVEPVKDIEGRVVRWFGTNTDITQQRQTEEELRRMNSQLEEFAYVASHDLQEPLRMVNIYAHLIARSVDEEDAKLNQYAAFVRQGVLRMEALIDDLLTFSRTVHTEEQPVGAADLSDSLRDALWVLKNRIEESGAVITADPLPEVRGDTAQMAHVFQNLLANGLKYCKKGACPEIHISAKQEGDQWIVSVRDSGIGFEPRYAERIFGLFKRLHKQEYPGTGLGLAICKRIVERYGGRMWAEGRPSEGATFNFSLARIGR